MTFNSVEAQSFLKDYNGLVRIMSEKSKQLQNQSQYDRIRQSITALATRDFGVSIEVYFFGSRIIGVATGQSDLDIYVCIGKKTFQMHSQSNEQEAMLQKLKEALQSSGAWESKSHAFKTPAPVLFNKFKPMNLDCDISIINGVATWNSLMLAHFFDIQPEAVSLVHFVKMWLKSQGFDHFKGYTVTLLVLFFLQSKNLMPSAEVVQQSVRKQSIDGWEVQFGRNKTLVDYRTTKMMSYKQYIKGFFEFYKDFNYSNVMSTHSGKSFVGSSYKARYPHFLLEGIFIAGPINQGINCGIVDESHKNEFVQVCKSSHDFLKNIAL